MSDLVDQQLVLPIRPLDDARFSNFFSVGNEGVVHSLMDHAHASETAFVYLVGATGTGKSHLLQAACHQAEEQAQSSVFLAADEIVAMSPEILESLENLDLVVIDNISVLAGLKEWEQALFHLFNRIKDNASRLIVSSETKANDSGFLLNDLVSRLNSGLQMNLNSLDDSMKIEALIFRANQRGILLTQSVAEFIVHRNDRNMTSLLTTLGQLDHSSFVKKRPITIPFIKELMSW